MNPAGRPHVGTPINVRLGDDLLAEVDAYAQAEGIKRAEAVRHLVKRGLRPHCPHCGGEGYRSGDGIAYMHDSKCTI